MPIQQEQEQGGRARARSKRKKKRKSKRKSNSNSKSNSKRKSNISTGCDGTTRNGEAFNITYRRVEGFRLIERLVKFSTFDESMDGTQISGAVQHCLQEFQIFTGSGRHRAFHYDRVASNTVAYNILAMAGPKLRDAP